MAIAIVFVVLISFLGVGAFLSFIYLRKIFREQKNYERGLKMVPLLIHLPPLSEDSETQGRDARDIINENISKAQVLYSILASTFQKGFKAKFYGQRHIALELVANKGAINLYVAVPVPLLGVVQQAVVSAYPSARLEEVEEHNIFSPVGRIGGTVGGELSLKEPFAYPIATFEDLKRDTMQALLNALSTLNKEDGAGLQILIRTADHDWRKRAIEEAKKKKEGKTKSKGFDLLLSNAGDVFGALAKPPEAKDEEKGPSDVSSLDQSLIQAIEEKTKQPGFEVMIRVVASSDVTHRAQTILNNLVASFSLFDAPGRNGFKYKPAKDVESFVTAYILRFFPQDKNLDILNTTELATLFHFPDQENIPTAQLERQSSKQVDGPRNMSEEGLMLGYNVFRGLKKAVRLDLNDRRRHLYVVGQTGTGKSVFMENLALQDMLEGRGFAFVDPHGDTAEKLLAMVPKERTEDVIYFSPADMEYPLGLNLFEFHSPDQKDFLIQEAINMLYKLYDPQHQGIMGPRYEHIFRNAALAIMADPEGGTFIDIPKLFRDPAFVEQKLKHVTDQNVLEFWRKEIPQSQRSNEFGEVTSWFVSKFGAFLSNEMMRNIIGQAKSSFDLRDVMDNNKILLVNLSKGRTGDLNSKLLGMIFVMKFQAAAMSRADTPEEYRKDFCLYVDEFQNFSTDSFATILSEARKYRLNLIVANQFTTQLSEEIRDAVFGNVGSIVSFRVGTTDAEFLAKQFTPVFDLDDLQRVPNYNTVVRMLIDGVPVQPFSMATLPPLGNPNPQLADALKQLSAVKHGRPKAEVEKEIFGRLATKAPERPALGTGFGSSNPFAQMPGGAPAWQNPSITAGSAVAPPANGALNGGPKTPAAPLSAKTGASFLDEWLAKRKSSTGPARAQSPAPPVNTQPVSNNPPDAPKIAYTPNLRADSPSLKLPETAQVESTPVPKPEAIKNDIGEFKIRRDDASSQNHESEVIHIDTDGNLSYK